MFLLKGLREIVIHGLFLAGVFDWPLRAGSDLSIASVLYFDRSDGDRQTGFKQVCYLI